MAALSPLFDTNILIDYLSGIEKARLELERYRHCSISIITWMEVMAGATSTNEARTRGFLATFVVFPITATIAEGAVNLRRHRKIKLPDAIILATAETEHRLLVTRNTRDFPAGEPGIRVPYRL